MSTGDIRGTVADPKIIFAAALKASASDLNNHPSGNLTASQSDIDLTRKLKEAGKFLEQLLDCVKVMREGSFSFVMMGRSKPHEMANGSMDPEVFRIISFSSNHFKSYLYMSSFT